MPLKFYFSITQLCILIPSGLLILASVVFFVRKNYKVAIPLLIAGGGGLRIMMAISSPFLYPWDEQFHALVAKNMLESPFKPLLYADPLIDYGHKFWTLGHVWLHKQPLFMWQMALSMKLFGVNEYALRVPTILMMTALIWVIYRMGALSVGKEAGFLAAFLFAVANYQMNLSAGQIGMDHNDAAFLFYVTMSIWGWMEYTTSEKRKWIFWIGFFVGLAVLNKWLTGIVVFAGWGLSILLDKEKRLQLKAYFPILQSATVAALTALPWQIYIMIRFPKESSFEYAYNSKHFFKVVEKHKGDNWFYLDKMENLYGELFPWLMALAFFFLIARIKEIKFRIGLLTILITTYTFFTLAATKLPSYVLTMAPIFYLALGTLLFEIYRKGQEAFPNGFAKTLLVLLILVTGFLHFDLQKIKWGYTPRSEKPNSRSKHIHNTAIYKAFNTKNLPPLDVVLNCPHYTAPAFMFYTGITAYNKFPNEEKYKELKANAPRIGIFVHGEIPDYIREDSTIVKLPFAVQ